MTVKPAPTEIKLTVSKELMSVGQTATLKTIFNEEAGGSYVYSVDPNDCTVIEDGKLTAKKEGTVTVTAEAYNGLKDSKTIEIKPAPDRIVLSKTKIKMGLKEKLTLKPEIANSSPATLKFKSSNKSVATVSSSGKITAKKVGTTKITITPNGDKTKAVTVTVKVSAAASKVKLSSKTLSLVMGQNAALTAKVTGASGQLAWKSSDEAVVTVSDGQLTAVGEGTATITVSTFNKKKASCTVTVTAPAVPEA